MRLASSLSWSAFVPFALCSVGCSALQPGEQSESLSDSGGSIVGGELASDYPEAVLVDMYREGTWVSICSGALVSPRVVLTAGHCVFGFDGWRVTAPFAGGEQRVASGAIVYDYQTSAEYVDPSLHDVGLVFLSDAISLDAYPALATAKLAKGTLVENVGRIDDGQASYTGLFVGAPVPVSDGATWGFPHSYVTKEVIQSGDSGGPVFVHGAPSRTIAAVNSGAGGGTQVLARVDLLSAWLGAQIASHEGSAPADPCGGLDYVGACDGTKVVWCESDKLQSLECAPQACGYNAKAGYFDCVAAP